MPVYHGSCHCRAVRFEMEADLATVIECNCSHCGKNGWLLAQVPADRMRLLSGEDGLVRYQFNTHRIEHLFCRTCGIHPFSRPAGEATMYMVNVRTLDDYDVDAEAPEVQSFDGRKL